MHELLISLVTEWIQKNNTVSSEIKDNTGGKLLTLFKDAQSQITAEKAFDFSDLDLEKLDETFIQRLYGSYCVTSLYGMPSAQ